VSKVLKWHVLWQVLLQVVWQVERTKPGRGQLNRFR
jgi:hypothetical protein